MGAEPPPFSGVWLHRTVGWVLYNLRDIDTVELASLPCGVVVSMPAPPRPAPPQNPVLPRIRVFLDQSCASAPCGTAPAPACGGRPGSKHRISGRCAFVGIVINDVRRHRGTFRPGSKNTRIRENPKTRIPNIIRRQNPTSRRLYMAVGGQLGGPGGETQLS